MKANLFLAAAPRSGSTQLAAWLGTHPAIGVSPIKEPNFFSSHEFPECYVRENHLSDVDPARYCMSKSRRQMQFAIFRKQEHYDYLFRTLGTRWRLDASTTYLHCVEAPEAMGSYNPDARVIILTRDPVARTLSHYRLARRTGRAARPLTEELRSEYNGETPLAGRYLLRQSHYADPVARFDRAFPPEQVLKLEFENLMAAPEAYMETVAQFLEIDPAGFDLGLRAQNAGALPRFAALNVWLLRTGLKSRLRYLLPRSVKAALKPCYFRPDRGKASLHEVEAVRRYLALQQSDQ